MTNRFGNFIKFFFPLTLFFIAVLLCVKNYSPGTYLIGWDSLHPEFNFPEAFGRIWGGVWRGEQGVGTIAAHSHMADLPRLIFLYISSFVLPVSFLRYLYVFLCLTLGPLGMYFFLKYVFQKETESVWVYPAAFLGGLFYLLNLGTVQNFYVPFEMFPTAFAFVPWLIFSGLKYLREGGRGNIVFWVTVVILSSGMAYASTLWYAVFGGLFIFFVIYSLISSAKKIKFKRVFNLGFLAIFLNLYWILPNVYSAFVQSDVISNSNINRLFSSEAFLRNRNHGVFNDILLQKNFLFEWRNFDFAKDWFGDLLGMWSRFLSNPIVTKIGYIFAGFSVLGLFLSVLKKEKVGLALIGTSVFALFFLININPPTGVLYAFLYNNFGIFREAFRMPFTKFSVLFELIMAFYFGYFALLLFGLKLKIFKPLMSFIKILFLVAAFAGLVFFTFPAFNGWLIGPNVKRQIPREYTQVFEWFNSNQAGRITLLPISSKYGWEYNSWGYEGSGFLTYGVKNPILYRDFDRWSKFNEDFYTQSSFALYANDNKGFEDSLKKYQVKYLLLDESVVNPGGDPGILHIPEIKDLISKSGNIKEAARFGFLTVYETDFDEGNNYVSAPREQHGNYFQPENIKPTGEVLSEDLTVNRGFETAYNCDLEKNGSVEKSYVADGILYKAKNGGVSCDYLSFPDFKYSQAYLLKIAGENKQGRSLKIYLTNYKTERSDLEELLPEGKFEKEFIIYPSNLEGAGYSLNFETRSFGRIASENLLSKVEFYPAKYTPDVHTKSVNGDLKIVNVQKYGSWAYAVDVQGNGLMQLGQGYEDGWMAFRFLNPRFQVFEHKTVSGWANGWNITPVNEVDPTIYVVFWPQLLEWVGMVLGIITLMVIFRLRSHPKT